MDFEVEGVRPRCRAKKNLEWVQRNTLPDLTHMQGRCHGL